MGRQESRPFGLVGACHVTSAKKPATGRREEEAGQITPPPSDYFQKVASSLGRAPRLLMRIHGRLVGVLLDDQVGHELSPAASSPHQFTAEGIVSKKADGSAIPPGSKLWNRYPEQAGTRTRTCVECILEAPYADTL
jgi:hypothetical protein